MSSFFVPPKWLSALTLACLLGTAPGACEPPGECKVQFSVELQADRLAGIDSFAQTLRAVPSWQGDTANTGDDCKPPPGRVIKWNWELDGDGQIAPNGQNAEVTLSAPGQYKVRLTAKDERWNNASASVDLEVLHEPAPEQLLPYIDSEIQYRGVIGACQACLVASTTLTTPIALERVRLPTSHDSVQGADLADWSNLTIQLEPADLGCAPLPAEFGPSDLVHSLLYIGGTALRGAMSQLTPGLLPCERPAGMNAN